MEVFRVETEHLLIFRIDAYQLFAVKVEKIAEAMLSGAVCIVVVIVGICIFAIVGRRGPCIWTRIISRLVLLVLRLLLLLQVMLVLQVKMKRRLNEWSVPKLTPSGVTQVFHLQFLPLPSSLSRIILTK